MIEYHSSFDALKAIARDADETLEIARRTERHWERALSVLAYLAVLATLALGGAAAWVL